MKKFILVAGGALMIAILSFLFILPLKVLSFIAPARALTQYSSITYGSEQRQSLDVYRPNHSSKAAPVIIFFYGGSWQSGDKESYAFVGRSLATQGYVVVVADYRVYPEVYFPAFIQDGALCTKWVYDHIAEYAGNPEEIFLMGHSAGAHIAAMLSLNHDYLKAVGGNPAIIKGTIGLAGPYDFLPLTDPILQKIFGKVDLATTQPINFVTDKVAPFLLMTGQNDPTVYPKNTSNLAEKLKAQHTLVTTVFYPDLSHADILLALSNVFSYKAPLLEEIKKFISQVRGKEGERP